MLPYRRFADTLTDADARLRADVDRYSFTVVDLHLLLFADFHRRTEFHELYNVDNRAAAQRTEAYGGKLAQDCGANADGTPTPPQPGHSPF